MLIFRNKLIVLGILCVSAIAAVFYYLYSEKEKEEREIISKIEKCPNMDEFELLLEQLNNKGFSLASKNIIKLLPTLYEKESELKGKIIGVERISRIDIAQFQKRIYYNTRKDEVVNILQNEEDDDTLSHALKYVLSCGPYIYLYLTEKTIERIFSLIETKKNEDLLSELIIVLVQSGIPEVNLKIKKSLLKHSNPFIKGFALYALSTYTKDVSLLPVILEGIRNENAVIQEYSIKAVNCSYCNIKKIKEVENILINKMNNKNTSAQTTAYSISALGRIKSKKAFPYVVGKINDNNGVIRQESILFICDTDDLSFLLLLITLVSDPSDFVSGQVKKTIIETGEVDFYTSVDLYKIPDKNKTKQLERWWLENRLKYPKQILPNGINEADIIKRFEEDIGDSTNSLPHIPTTGSKTPNEPAKDKPVDGK